MIYHMENHMEPTPAGARRALHNRSPGRVLITRVDNTGNFGHS